MTGFGEWNMNTLDKVQSTHHVVSDPVSPFCKVYNAVSWTHRGEWSGESILQGVERGE